jgi:hypothetical protein
LPTTEHTINDALAELLRQSRSLWRTEGIVTSETTGMLSGSSRRPDILIIEPNVSPVVIETEFQKRSQLFIRSHDEPLSVIAVRVGNPDRSPLRVQG